MQLKRERRFLLVEAKKKNKIRWNNPQLGWFLVNARTKKTFISDKKLLELLLHFRVGITMVR